MSRFVAYKYQQKQSPVSALIGLQQHIVMYSWCAHRSKYSGTITCAAAYREARWTDYMSVHVHVYTIAFWRYQLILCSSTNSGIYTLETQTYMCCNMYRDVTVFEKIVVWYQSTDPDIRLNRQTLTTWQSASSQSKQLQITPATTHTHHGMYTSLPPPMFWANIVHNQ